MPALRRKRGPMHEINVVPYVDVMLVLLVIFMVTAPLVTPAVIDLPTVGKASAPRLVPLEVYVRADQGITVRSRDRNGAVISEQRVAERARARTARPATGVPQGPSKRREVASTAIRPSAETTSQRAPS